MKRNGFVLAGSAMLAAFSPLLLAACQQQQQQTDAFASTPASKAAEGRLRRADTMPALQPFDEQFVTVADTPDTP